MHKNQNLSQNAKYLGGYPQIITNQLQTYEWIQIVSTI